METLERDRDGRPDRELYALRHLSPEASNDDVKRAYRQWAQVYHPGKHQASQMQDIATQNFQKIREAYEILSDERKRQIYDLYGMIPKWASCLLVRFWNPLGPPGWRRSCSKLWRRRMIVSCLWRPRCAFTSSSGVLRVTDAMWDDGNNLGPVGNSQFPHTLYVLSPQQVRSSGELARPRRRQEWRRISGTSEQDRSALCGPAHCNWIWNSLGTVHVPQRVEGEHEAG